MSKKQKRILWPVLLVAVVVSIAIGFVWARTATGRSTSPGTGPARPALIETSAGLHVASIASQQNLLPQVEAELITIRPTGFDPAAIARPAIPFFLAVDNRSDHEEIALELRRASG